MKKEESKEQSTLSRRWALLSHRASSPPDGLSGSVHLCLFCFLPLLVSSPTFPGPPEGGSTTQDECVGGGRRRVNCPDLSVWGVAPSQVDGILPTVAARQGCPPRPGHLVGPWPPGDMLSTTMVGALVRGWRNRSSPRRAESKLIIPQSQDEIQTRGRFVTLL